MQISYKKKEYLQTRSEHELFLALKKAVTEDIVVIPQVQLGRILDMTCQPAVSKCKYYFYHGINQLSFDFVLFNKSFTALVAVELDDKSHLRRERKSRDKFVEEVCKEAELPLLRLPVTENYDFSDLREKITKILH